MPELPALTVANALAWSRWLAEYAATSTGVTLTVAKKGRGLIKPTSLTYAEALDEALCHGWIDSTGRSTDENTQTFRFTPRKKNSQWSKRNVMYVERLERESRMQDAGRKAVDEAKANGRWDAAYAQAGLEPPPELLVAIEADPAARATWDILTKTNRFLLCHRLNALKTEAGRRKRIAATVEMLAAGKTPQPQKRSLTAPLVPIKVTKSTRAPAVSAVSTRRSNRQPRSRR